MTELPPDATHDETWYEARYDTDLGPAAEAFHVMWKTTEQQVEELSGDHD
jgi:hypothetical protein